MRAFFKLLTLLSFMVLLAPIAHADIIWQQSFDNSPTWASTSDVPGSTGQTHAFALSHFDASGYRISGQSFINLPMLEVSPNAGRNGGKGLIYRMEGAGTWRAASIDLDFADPDVKWATNNISRNGYDEIWYRVWYRAPQGLDFETNVTQSGGFRLWKAMRAYSFDPEAYCPGCSDPDT